MTTTFVQRALAFSVHVFTSTGLIAAFLAMVAITREDWQGAMFWLFVTLLIDGIDGTFARLFKVKERLPGWDGKTIDYVIDFATYAIIPAFFIFEAKLEGGRLLPEPEWIRLVAVSVILVVSALYYGKEGMVSEDSCFVGFPVLWNMVAFYLFFILPFGPWINFGFILFIAILHFIPLKYAYPSRRSSYFWPTIVNAAIFIIVNLMILFLYPDRPPVLVWISMLTVLYFLILALYKTYFEEKNQI